MYMEKHSVLPVVSHIHWGSWNVTPTDGGERGRLLYFITLIISSVAIINCLSTKNNIVSLILEQDFYSLWAE